MEPGAADHLDVFYHFPDAQDAGAENVRASTELGFRQLDVDLFEPTGR